MVAPLEGDPAHHKGRQHIMENVNTQSDLFIGVDGGQTTTLTALATAAGEILSYAMTGPCDNIHEPGGLERQYGSLRQGYESVFANLGLPPGHLKGVYLGVTGAGHQPTIESVYDADHITFFQDVVTALSGAIPSMHGLIIIAGTGSVAYGQNPQGQAGMAGGKGYYVSDEGSASDIARLAFRAVFQALDGRGPQTTLLQRLLDYYDCPDITELHRRVYGEFTRDRLAQAAGVVGQAAAEDGDSVAIALLDQAGYELGRQITAVLRRLDWLDQPVPIAPIGGVFQAGAFVTEPMMAHVHQSNPAAYLQPPRFPPVIGALLLAYRTAGLTITDAIIDNLDRTRHVLPAKT